MGLLHKKITVRTFFFSLFFIGFFSISFAETQEEPQSETSSRLEELKNFISWPFIHIIQPVFSIAIYPIAEPLLYAFHTGVIEKGVDLITFGEKRNIQIYPTLNLKPGPSTMLGAFYRHSGFITSNDYFVLSASAYSNSDIYFYLRYSQKRLFDDKTYLSVTHSIDMNRDGNFVIPSSPVSFLSPDTTYRFDFNVAHPVPFFHSWNMQLSTGVRFKQTGIPDVEDEWISEEYFKYLKEGGIYQDYRLYPTVLSISYDDTESPFVPTSGQHFTASLSYNFVSDYYDIPQEFENKIDSKLNHNFYSLHLVFQKYFYFGEKEKNYQYTMKEARAKRKEYMDFSLDRTLQYFDPSKISSWILERRVLAMQLRYMKVFEVEEGGMPIRSYPKLNERFPLRGYSFGYAAKAIAGASFEYRWPIDYYIDGVAFLEYGVFSDEDGIFNFENIRNSWGFGVRVRRPDMYFFRVQIGFHGLHGFHTIITIAPEFY